MLHSILLDRHYSQLLEQQALLDGLIDKDAWSKEFPHSGEHWNFFPNITDGRWRREVDRVLTLISLFESVSTTYRYYDWVQHSIIPHRSLKLPLNFEPTYEDWQAAVASAIATAQATNINALASSMSINPEYIVDAHNVCTQADESGFPEVGRVFRSDVLGKWSGKLHDEIFEFLIDLYKGIGNGSLPIAELESVRFWWLFRNKYGDAHTDSMHVTELDQFISFLMDHVNFLIKMEILGGQDIICTKFSYSSRKGSFEGLADTAMLVRANFAQHLSVVPAPRTIEEAVELRCKPEIARLAELIRDWSNAAESGEMALEKKIAKDILKAQRELQYLNRIREFSSTDLCVWVKAIGGQIPYFSNILSGAEFVIHYTDKWRRSRNVWVSVG